MDGEFVNLTPEDSGSKHLCCVIRLKTVHLGVEAKRARLAARFVHVDTLEEAKSLPCAFNNRAVFYDGKFVTVNQIDAAELSEMLVAWAEQAEKYRSGEINREDYDKWRYNYPKYDETSGYVKVPSQQLSDALVEAFKDRLRADHK